MSNFPVLDHQTAPAASRPLLQQAKKDNGFVPNLAGVLSQSPAALGAYGALSQAFASTSLDPVEQQLVLISVSAENDCEYCVAAHSTVARMVKMPPEILAAIRDERALPDPKLEALRRFALAVVRKRGWVDDEDQRAFYEAGYEPRHALDVITGVTLKTLSNYTNHLAETPLDKVFQRQSWSKGSRAA